MEQKIIDIVLESFMNISEINYVPTEEEVEEVVKNWLSSSPTNGSDVNNLVAGFEEIINLNYGFDHEVIYHSVAMKILVKNDPSLSSAFRLANDIGMSLVKLDSCILASLLLEEYAKEEWDEICSSLYKRIELVLFSMK